ncbi:MAG: hypothetical protein J3K34DRAFT_480720 [Monoraphidium minutum]|nr:MAG: hypothetical protein J3K34DRAFT_480720 [Monoraphidium minutum]
MERTFAYTYSADGAAQAVLLGGEAAGAAPGAAGAAAAAAPTAGAVFRERFKSNPEVFNVQLVADPGSRGAAKVPVVAADLARWSAWFAGVLEARDARGGGSGAAAVVDLRALPIPVAVAPAQLEALVASLYEGRITLDGDSVEGVLRAADAMQVDVACAACEAYLLLQARELADAGDMEALCGVARAAAAARLARPAEEAAPHLARLTLQGRCGLAALAGVLAAAGGGPRALAALRRSGLAESLLASLLLSMSAAGDEGQGQRLCGGRAGAATPGSGDRAPPPSKRTRSGGGGAGLAAGSAGAGVGGGGLQVADLLPLLDWGGMRPAELGALLQQAAAAAPGAVADAVARHVGAALVRGGERQAAFGERLMGLVACDGHGGGGGGGGGEGAAFRDYVRWSTRELQVAAAAGGGGEAAAAKAPLLLAEALRRCAGVYFFALGPTGAAMSEVFSREAFTALPPGRPLVAPGLLGRWRAAGLAHGPAAAAAGAGGGGGTVEAILPRRVTRDRS